MTDKLFKILIIAMLCCSFIIGPVSACAVKGDDTGFFEEIITDGNNKTTEDEFEVESTDDEDFMPTDIDFPTEEDTTKSKPQKETTTRKPHKPKKPHKNNKYEEENKNENKNENEVNNNYRPNREGKTTENEETTLPENAFFVFLERNNGSRRLKTIMEGKGLVPYPSDPIRKGYIFAGWYKDKNLKTPWDFNSDYAEKQMTIYAKWIADKNTLEYDITIDTNIIGGKVEVNPQKATKGEPVVITAIPDEGNRLKQGTITINGKKSDVLSFLMPAKSVTISAEFEKIPQNVEDEEKSVMPFILIAMLVLIVAIIIASIIIKRKKDIENIKVDENGTVIDDDEGDGWVDKSIVVENGFKNGEKIKGNQEPDYGAPDVPDDEDWFN